MRLPKPLLVALLATTWALPAGAQTPQVALQENDPILTLGTLRFVNKLHVNNRGVQLAEIVVNDPDPSRSSAVLANGFPIMVQSDPVLDPGGQIKSWASIMANSAGNLGFVMNLANPPAGGSADSGVYWNSSLLALENDEIVNATVPAGLPLLGAGTTYTKFTLARINKSDSVIVLGEINDPTIGAKPGDKEGAIFRIDTDGMGGVTQVEVLVKEEDPDLVNGAWTVKGVSTLTNTLDMNDRNEWIGQLGVSGGLKANTAIVVNGVQVAREGDPAPVEGRVWDDLVNPSVSINNLGDWVFQAQLAAISQTAPNDRQTIVKNGDVFVRQLDTIPSLAPAQVDRMGAAPVVIADSGDIFWYTSTTDPVLAQDTVYMRNYDILVQEGITVVNGGVVTRLLSTQYAFSVSPSGRFWIGEVDIQGTGEAMLMLDFGSVIPVPGCRNRNAGTLVKAAGDPIIGGTVTFEMDNAQGVGAATRLLFSAALANPGSECGLGVPFGELLIALGPNLIATAVGQDYTGSPVQLPFNLPPDPALVDLKLWAQGAFLDIGGVTGGKKIVLTNAIEIEIGAP